MARRSLYHVLISRATRPQTALGKSTDPAPIPSVAAVVWVRAKRNNTVAVVAYNDCNLVVAFRTQKRERAELLGFILTLNLKMMEKMSLTRLVPNFIQRPIKQVSSWWLWWV
jgi:hypothetical protein